MAKRVRLRAGPTRKHQCSRCHVHKRRVTTLRKASGRRYALCDGCLRANTNKARN